MGRVIGMMVVKDESSRYLSSVLEWHLPLVDVMCVYDDQSSDDTVRVAKDAGCLVVTRPDGIPTLLEHEGRFRQAAWDWMEETAGAVDGDWILLLDADEFVVAEEGIRLPVQWCKENDTEAIITQIHEVWTSAGDVLYKRVDGFWDTIQRVRLVKWKPNGRFPDKELAPGSSPIYPFRSMVFAEDINVLHVGYLNKADAKIKYDRYKSLPGHNPVHIKSILEPGRMEQWEGIVPFSSTTEDQSPIPAPC